MLLWNGHGTERLTSSKETNTGVTISLEIKSILDIPEKLDVPGRGCQPQALMTQFSGMMEKFISLKGRGTSALTIRRSESERTTPVASVLTGLGALEEIAL